MQLASRIGSSNSGEHLWPEGHYWNIDTEDITLIQVSFGRDDVHSIFWQASSLVKFIIIKNINKEKMKYFCAIILMIN